MLKGIKMTKILAKKACPGCHRELPYNPQGLTAYFCPDCERFLNVDEVVNLQDVCNHDWYYKEVRVDYNDVYEVDLDKKTADIGKNYDTETPEQQLICRTCKFQIDLIADDWDLVF